MSNINHGQQPRPMERLRTACEYVRNNALRIYAIGALALTLSLDITHEPHRIPNVKYDTSGCVQPSPSDTDYILQIASQPGNPIIAAADSNMGNGKDVPQPAAEAYRQETARRYGLHIYDAEPIIRQLLAKDPGYRSLSYKQYLSAAQEFMAKLGVEVRLATPDDYLAEGGRPLTAAELASPAMKISLINLLHAHSNMPAEYVALAGERYILLAGGMAQNDVAAYANTGIDHDTTVYDATIGISMETYNHELGHLADRVLCGPAGMSTDKAFAAINGGNPDLYNGKTRNPDMPNYTNYANQYYKKYSSAANLAAAGNITEACRLLGQLDAEAAKLTSWSAYHPTPAEGKAELYANLPTPNSYNIMLDPRNAVLREQFVFLLARLHAADPRLVKYFLAVSTRPAPYQPAVCNASTFKTRRPVGGNYNAPDSNYQK